MHFSGSATGAAFGRTQLRASYGAATTGSSMEVAAVARVEHPLGRLAVVRRLGEEDVGDVSSAGLRS